MFLTLAHSFLLLQQYKYLIIFPIMVIEGPIITVVSGFLTHANILNGFVTFPLLMLGDIVGDILHYYIGKYGKKSRFIRKIAGFLGYNEDKERILISHFKKHTGKTLLIAKVSHGVGGIIQMASGVAEINILDFIWYCFLGTVPKTTVLFFVGYFLGSSYEKIDSYFDIAAWITVGFFIFFIILYFALSKYLKRFLADSVDKT